jgi:ELWxxDGT repeat protein
MFSRSRYAQTLLFCCLCLAVPVSAQTLLRNIGIDSLPGTNGLYSSNPKHFTSLNDSQFVFRAFFSPLESENLYVSNGTESGTRQIGKVFATGQMIRFRDQVYFSGTSTSEPIYTGLWKTDGTEAGTVLIFASAADIDSVPMQPADFFVLNDFLIFSGLTATHGTELWRSDGTAEGTSLLSDIFPGSEDGFRGEEPAVIDDILYFSGFRTAREQKPWQTDGTPEGTHEIWDLSSRPGSLGAHNFTASGGFIYFSGYSSNSGWEVRRFVAGQPGLELIGEGEGSTDSSYPRNFVDADGTLFYLTGRNGFGGARLMSYDHVGEPQLITSSNSFPQILKPFGRGRVVFKAEDARGRELWISDGTVVGTHRIADLNPGQNNGIYPTLSAESFHVFQDSLVYYAGSDGVAADGNFDFELFVTDGTEEGTKLVSDQVPGTKGSNPNNFFSFKNRLYFAATGPTVGREPFYLDPTASPVSIFQPYLPRLGLQVRALPNPVHSGEAFRVDIELNKTLKLTGGLYDLRGILVRNLPFPAGQLQAGHHSIRWRLPAGIRPGIYFVRLVDNGGVASLRLVVTK